MKKSEWFICDYSINDIEPEELAVNINHLCNQGWEIFQIDALTRNISVDKIRNSFGDIAHEGYLGQDDHLLNHNFNRIFFKK